VLKVFVVVEIFVLSQSSTNVITKWKANGMVSWACVKEVTGLNPTQTQSLFYCRQFVFLLSVAALLFSVSEDSLLKYRFYVKFVRHNLKVSHQCHVFNY